MPRNSCHSYLLRSLIRCAVCGLSFCGTWTRGPRYRCNGSMAHRGPFAGKCIGASIKGEHLEDVVWSDVSRFLLNPSDLVDELLAESNDIESRAVAEAERASLIDARSAAQHRRKRAIDLYTRGKLSEIEFDAIAADVERELKTLDERLAGLEPADDPLDDAASEDVLAEIRQRLTGDLSDSERREIVQLLVRRITVHTTLPDRGRKQVRVVIDYRFPPGGAARTGIAASSSYNLSPHHRRLTPTHLRRQTFSGFNGRRQSLSVPVSQPDRCKEDIPKARVRLRSTAPALLLQSPVQRAGRVIGFPDAERTCRRSQLSEGAFIVDTQPPYC